MTEQQISGFRQMEERSSLLKMENQKLQRELDAVSVFFLRGEHKVGYEIGNKQNKARMQT